MPVDSDPPASTGVYLFVAIGVGLTAVILAAWATSVYGTDETLNWIITGAVGLVATLGTYLFMRRRAAAGATTIERKAGEH